MPVREPGYRHIALFAASIVAMLFGWRWGDQIYFTAPRSAYWLGVAASALPAAAAWWSSLQLRRLRANGHASRMERVFDALRWIAFLFLVIMALIPLI